MSDILYWLPFQISVSSFQPPPAFRADCGPERLEDLPALLGGFRTDAGAIPFPTPEEAAAHEWTDEDRALVVDRVDTQIVGSPATVAAKLDILQEATGADEIVVTTITHDHVDRVRSYALLAEEWFRDAPAPIS